MSILETERLTLREASLDDAEFFLRLLNEPSFLRFIGDRGVRSMADARTYIQDRLIESYRRYGFGLWMVELKDPRLPIGICGLVKRDTLPEVDVGFAFLPEHWLAGFAYESATAVMQYATTKLRLARLLAITNPDNVGSIKLLEKLGMRFDRMVTLADGAPELRLFAYEMESS